MTKLYYLTSDRGLSSNGTENWNKPQERRGAR